MTRLRNGSTRRLSLLHPAAYEPDVAMTLNNLGTLLCDLGERDEARHACHEALEILWPLANQWPKAYVYDFRGALNNYLIIVGEAPDDRWYQIWQQQQPAASDD